ncbi:PTS system glucose-specific IIA component [Paenibacillus phyllosphaerae]|uniref:PTS system glucose-specific IIA component n=1 Tax=Paenibacillus phyllosphaerae TaxID=274593 RepID=A0A7W5ATY1_9BACL|nr:PTS glucose transporter subunit IIA [Paenibacillus phyllosphaerae]MBB3108608.1 PTS system glucose-specific IIA component [Paenibacillus phyllosphaerae]
MFGKLFKAKKETFTIRAPITGKAVSLTEVPDEAFAAGHMGKGIAIEPTVGKVVAPFDAIVAHIIHTNHAVILEHASGLQLLIHVGINTVAMKGEGFNGLVQMGDQVRAGQTLIEFDIEKIRTAGYPLITPVVIANEDEAVTETEVVEGKVTAGQDAVIHAVLAK